MRRSKRAHVQLKKKCATLHEELNEIETPGEGLHSFCRNLKCNCIFSPREEELFHGYLQGWTRQLRTLLD